MLTVKYTDDASLLAEVYGKTLRGGKPDEGINALLYDGDNPVGFCKIRLTDEGCEIADFAIAEESDAFPTRDFFFRAVLFKLSNTGVDIIVNSVDDRLTKFGFVAADGRMTVTAADVLFPSQCGGHH